MIRPAAVGLAAVIGGAVGIASMTAATAVTVPLTADFGVLLPGASAEASTELSVPVASVVTEAAWLETTGAGAWEAHLCSPALCTPLDALEGDTVAAGAYRVVVSVSMPTDASAAGRTTATGRISLMESAVLADADGSLATTGTTLPWLAGIAGALAIGGGTAILIRRRTNEKEKTR